MPPDDYLSDEYVAGLLKKDASTIKYSAMGMASTLPKRATSTAPKPNTQFLKNIMRDTTNHNAALKAKEEEEAAARLRRLGCGDAESRIGRPSDNEESTSGYARKRQRMDDGRRRRDTGKGRKRTESPESPKKRDRDERERRRRRDDRRREVSDERLPHRSSRDGRDRRDRSHRDRSRSRSPERRRRRDRDSEAITPRQRSPKTGGCRDARRRDRARSRSPAFDLAGAFDKARRRRNRRSQSRSRERVSRSGAGKPTHRPDTAPHRAVRDRVPPKHREPSPLPDAEMADADSDPLETIVGPLPPLSPTKVRRRGRGVLAASSGIDSRFSSNYDPTVDVQPDSEDDWDQALEALKDRQKWNQQGADRLRAAGFSEQEVAAWKKGGEKNENDVRWTAKGEAREWDRGKVVTDNGVETGPEWGRLKGT